MVKFEHFNQCMKIKLTFEMANNMETFAIYTMMCMFIYTHHTGFCLSLHTVVGFSDFFHARHLYGHFFGPFFMSLIISLCIVKHIFRIMHLSSACLKGGGGGEGLMTLQIVH